MTHKCPHPAWCYDLEYDRWIAEKLDYVHTEVDTVWCDDCGEYRTRANGSWESLPPYTAEELAEAKVAAEEMYNRFFNDKGQ